MTSPSPGGSPATRPRLTRSGVLAAALDLVDREGTEALSMRRLGKELGVEAMSLYNHVPNKAALLDGLVEQVISEIERPDPSAPWTQQVREMAEAYRRLAVEHPNVLPLIAQRPFNTTASLEPLDRALGLFRSAGFDDESALHAFRTIVSFATGYTLAETQGFFGEHTPRDTDDVIHPRDLDPEQFPNLTDLLPTIATCDHDAEFAFALDAIIQGLQTKLA